MEHTRQISNVLLFVAIEFVCTRFSSIQFHFSQSVKLNIWWLSFTFRICHHHWQLRFFLAFVLYLLKSKSRFYQKQENQKRNTLLPSLIRHIMRIIIIIFEVKNDFSEVWLQAMAIFFAFLIPSTDVRRKSFSC